MVKHPRPLELEAMDIHHQPHTQDSGPLNQGNNPMLPGTQGNNPLLPGTQVNSPLLGVTLVSKPATPLKASAEPIFKHVYTVHIIPFKNIWFYEYSKPLPPLFPGYGAPPTGPPGCPPGVAPDVYTWFVAVDTDKSGQITAKELQAALTNGNWSNFNAETCRLMIGEFGYLLI